MNKHYYSEYVRHCMRFYSRNINNPRFNTDVDKNNWYACHRAIERFSERDKDVLLRVYSLRDTMADNIFETAKLYNMDQTVIWDMVKDFERSVAKKRGLL